MKPAWERSALTQKGVPAKKPGRKPHKLTRAKVLDILEQLRCGVPGTKLARKYKIANSMIAAIKAGQVWAAVHKEYYASLRG